MKTRPVDLATLKEIRVALHISMHRINQLKDIYNNPKIQEIHNVPDLQSVIYKMQDELLLIKDVFDNVAHIQNQIEY